MFRITCLPAQNRFKRKLLFYAAAILAAASLFSGCIPWSNSPTQEITPVSSATLIALPDLMVASVQAATPDGRSCSDPAADFALHIVIRNQGDGMAGPFEVITNGSQRRVSEGLTAGGEIEFVLDGYTADLIVEIDRANLVQESNEANNLFQAAIPFPSLPEECLFTPTPQTAVREALFTMQGHTGKVLSVAFSPDGNLVASGSVDNTLRLWRVKEGTLLRTMTGHPFPVLEVVFSPNGTDLATGSSDGIIRIWSVSNGLLSKTLQAHGGAITDLEYTPDNRQLLSSAQDFTVRIWNSADGRLLKTVDEGMAVVNSLASSNNGKEVAWAESDGSLRVMRLSDGAWLNRWQGIQQPATSLARSPDGRLLASGYQDGRIQLWSLPQGTLLDTLEGHKGAVTSLVFAPDGKWLASSSEDASLRLWGVEVEKVGESTPTPGGHLRLSQVYLGHTGHVNEVAFSPKGGFLASGGDDGTVRLWVVPEN